tara:strand:- start:456 stop:1100 length:645 start_codon:yes stop_codon:yes gene_type:complete
MKKFVQVILSTFFLFYTTQSFAAKIEEKAVKQAEDVKFMLTSKKKSLNLIQDGIDRINENCCEDNFYKKNKILKIKNNLEKCISDKCYDKYFLIFLTPPPKAIALRQINEIDGLILENEKVKYENASIQKTKQDKINLKKTKNEKNIEILRQSLENMNIENIKLKKKVDLMLSKYQKQIDILEEKNSQLNIKFEQAYEMLSKSKQKKLNKILPN